MIPYADCLHFQHEQLEQNILRQLRQGEVRSILYIYFRFTHSQHAYLRLDWPSGREVNVYGVPTQTEKQSLGNTPVFL